MKPLFSPSVDLVGWLNADGFIYDLTLTPKAFVSDENAFSYPNCIWLGSVEGTTMRDRLGKPVTFNPDLSPSGSVPPLAPLKPLKPLQPLKPLNPLTPLRPLTPLTPLGGWSSLKFAAWLAGT